jgi:hypothetical protein
MTTSPAITIGQWEILLTTSLIIPEGESARLILTPEDPLIVNIRFVTTPEAQDEQQKTTLTASGEGNNGGLLFTNWNNSLGATTALPMEFASDDSGRQIAVMASAKKIGACHEVFLQFMRRAQS